jgi:hypothetical protein
MCCEVDVLADMVRDITEMLACSALHANVINLLQGKLSEAVAE